MRCGRCRAEVLLGSAQCHRCGASMLEGIADDPAVRAPTRPLPRPPRPTRPPPPTAAQPVTKGGCGCLGLVALAFLLPIGLAMASVVSGIVESVSGNDEPDDAGVLLVGESLPGAVGDEESDLWRLIGTGELVEIAVVGEAGFDARLEVRDAGGRVAAADDTDGRDPVVVVLVDAGVVYDVLVSGFADASGSYDIRVEPVPGVQQNGGPLVVGQPVSATAAEGEAVRYTLVGEGREVTIRVTGHGGFDPTVAVTGAAGDLLGFDDDGAGVGRDALLRVTVPDGVEVVVSVAGFDNEGGSFTVEVT